MKNFFVITTRAATVLFLLLAMVLVGCAPQTGTTTSQYDKNWRFVPRIHVEENSFGVSTGMQYDQCSYDMEYEGYWCRVD
jgi:hypothetical protein